eukprot:s361_g11.t1
MIRRPWPLALLPLAHLGLRSLSAVPAAPSLFGKPVVLDRLCRGWQIHQVKNGYRFNGDDLLLAREAWRAKANSKRLLDLGAGVDSVKGLRLDVGWIENLLDSTGSVGLFWLAQQSHDAELTAVEAQEESVELLSRTVKLLNLEQRVQLINGDLRNEPWLLVVIVATLLAQLGRFDLVTANPPYIAPEDRTHAGIVHVHRRADDVLDAVQAANLVPERRLTALSRGEPKWQVLVCGSRMAAGRGFHANIQIKTPGTATGRDVELREEELVVRDHQGLWTKDWDALCAEMGAFQKPELRILTAAVRHWPPLLLGLLREIWREVGRRLRQLGEGAADHLADGVLQASGEAIWDGSGCGQAAWTLGWKSQSGIGTLDQPLQAETLEAKTPEHSALSDMEKTVTDGIIFSDIDPVDANAQNKTAGTLDQLLQAEMLEAKTPEQTVLSGTNQTMTYRQKTNLDVIMFSAGQIVLAFAGVAWCLARLNTRLTKLKSHVDHLDKEATNVSTQTDWDKATGSFSTSCIDFCIETLRKPQLMSSTNCMDPHAVSNTSSSAGSTGSWTHVTGEPCCYLPDTYFKVMTADGEILSPAKMLFNGAIWRASGCSEGTLVEVVHPPEQHQVDAVIELKADHSFLVVSPDHRILIPGNKTVHGQRMEARADHGVEDFFRPPSILSKGSRKKQFRRGKKRDGGDAVTIPGWTSQYLSDLPAGSRPCGGPGLVSWLMEGHTAGHIDLSNFLFSEAKSYEAYADLQLQLHTGQILREYMVLCHGFVAGSGRATSAGPGRAEEGVPPRAEAGGDRASLPRRHSLTAAPKAPPRAVAKEEPRSTREEEEDEESEEEARTPDPVVKPRKPDRRDPPPEPDRAPRREEPRREHRSRADYGRSRDRTRDRRRRIWTGIL